jgi:hypothetical protein
MGKGEAYTGVWFENLEGKRPLGTARRRWEGNIKKHLKEMGCRGVSWIELTRNRDRWRELVNVGMNLFYKMR